MVKFLFTVYGRLKIFAVMNLKILFTFMLWVGEALTFLLVQTHQGLFLPVSFTTSSVEYN